MIIVFVGMEEDEATGRMVAGGLARKACMGAPPSSNKNEIIMLKLTQQVSL